MGDPQVKDHQVKVVVVMVMMVMMMTKQMMMKVKRTKISEDEHKNLKFAPGQTPVMIGDRIYFVQPTTVEYGLTAPGSNIPSPRHVQVLEEVEEVPLPLVLQALPLDPLVQNKIRVTKGTRVIKGTEVQRGDKGDNSDKGNPGVQGSLLVYKLELENAPIVAPNFRY